MASSITHTFGFNFHSENIVRQLVATESTQLQCKQTKKKEKNKWKKIYDEGHKLRFQNTKTNEFSDFILCIVCAKKIAYKNHMQLQRSRNSLASRFYELSPKKRFKRQQQQKCSEKIVVTCSNLFVSTCEIADFQFRFLIEIHFDIFIYSQFLIYQTEINTVCKNGHVIGLSSLNREHAPLQWIPITHFVYYHHELTLTTA